MGEPWCSHQSFRLVEQLGEATGRDIASLLLDADAEELKATRNAQLATYTLSMVILEAARGVGLEPAAALALAGHSLGEYSALVAAGVLTPTGGARLVAERAEAMQAAAEASPGTMAAVLGLEADLVAKACEGVKGAWLANDNAPGQVVVAGTASGVAEAGQKATEMGAKRVMPLAVGGAFHSPLMAASQSRLDEALRAARFEDASPPVVANVDAEAHTSGWADLLSRQLVSPVRWRQSLCTLAGLGATRFVELGPGTELSGMVKRTVAGGERVSVGTPEALAMLA